MPGTLWGFHSRVEPEHHLVTELSWLGEKRDRHMHEHGNIGDFCFFTGMPLFVWIFGGEFGNIESQTARQPTAVNRRREQFQQAGDLLPIYRPTYLLSQSI